MEQVRNEELKSLISSFEGEMDSIISPDYISTLRQVVAKFHEIVENSADSADCVSGLSIPISSDPKQYLQSLLRIESSQIRSNLPIYKCKMTILNAAVYKKLLIVQGDTGCGKSTLIPQYFFSDPRFHASSVYVTEPRRLAALSLAKKVGKDQPEIPVFSCASPYDLEKIPKGALVYLSESIFLHFLFEEMHKDLPLKDVKVVMLDEVHEYSVEIEIILALLLKFVRPKRPDLSIIITSATIQRQELSALLKCPVIECHGKAYEVEVHYLNQYDNFYFETLNTVERLIYTSEPKTILVFLTALHQLQSARTHLRKFAPKVEVLLLYGKQDAKDQDKVMTVSSNIRVIFATNFAESSLTIPNVTHVVDCGREKVRVMEETNLYHTKTEFISKASAIQRKGRAGREMQGQCFRMYTYEESCSMEAYKKPEILTSNLELILLKFLKNNLNILEMPLIHCPTLEKIKGSFYSMLSNEGIKLQDRMFTITKMGIFMSQVDFDPILSKLIFLSQGCVEIITIACVLKSSDYIFTSEEWIKSDYYSTSPELLRQGDFLLALLLARQYYFIKCNYCPQYARERFGNDCHACNRQRKSWATAFQIQEKTLNIAFDMQQQIADMLALRNWPIKYLFTQEETDLEIKLASFKPNQTYLAEARSCYEKVIQNYIKRWPYIQELIIKSMFRNLAEFIGCSGIQSGYLRLENKDIVTPEVSSAVSSSNLVHKFLICYKFNKGNRLNMMHICPVSLDTVVKLKGNWLQSIQWSENSAAYETIKIINKGRAYFQEIFSQNYSSLQIVEEELAKVNIKGLVYFDRKAKTVNLTVVKANVPQAKEILDKELESVRKKIYAKHQAHVSMSSLYCILLGPGCKVEEIISLHDEIKYRIVGVDRASSNICILKDLKNTFEFNFASIERHFNEKSCEITVFFNSANQAEIAIAKLRIQPLKGFSGPIFEMQSIANSTAKGTKLKVIIPFHMTQDEINSMFKFYQHSAIKTLTRSQSNTEVLVKFNNYQDTDYFANNFRLMVRDKFRVSAASAKVLPEGILIPKNLLKFQRKIRMYMKKITTENNCSISFNNKFTKIYCAFSKLPEAAKDAIMLLLKNETVKVSDLLWNEITSMSHKHIDSWISWNDWVVENYVNVTYFSNREILSIYGLPNKRINALNYLREIIGQISSKTKTISIPLYRRNINIALIKQVAKAHQISVSIDENNERAEITGIENKINEFLQACDIHKSEPFAFKDHCNICLTSTQTDSFELSLCGHTIHIPCFIQSINSNLTDFNSLIPISCIYCSADIIYDDLLKICSTNLLKKIEVAAVNNYIYKTGKKKYTWCENSECNHIYNIESVLSKGNTIRHCPQCKNNYCYICKSQAFDNHDIICERTRIQIHEEENEEWIVKNTTTCPKCKFSFEKTGGCNHLICPCCSNHFCFLCVSNITDAVPVDHYRIKSSSCYQRYMG